MKTAQGKETSAFEPCVTSFLVVEVGIYIYIYIYIYMCV